MDTTGLTLILSFKWLFPAMFGSVLAVIKKAKELGWEGVPLNLKLKMWFVLFGSFLIGIVLSYYLGGWVMEFFDIDTTSFLSKLVYMIFGFSGTKIVDTFAVNQDKWLNSIFEGISAIIEKFIGRFK